MKRNDDIINVSTKHVRLRTVLFCVFAALAITGITFGVLQIGKKTEGFQTVTAQQDDDLPRYQNGVQFTYLMQGSSSEIKLLNNELTRIYTDALKRSWKLLSAVETYADTENLASLNENVGQPVSVPQELYDILLDADRKTREQKGYSLYAGALYAEQNAILVLYDAQSFDPLVNEDSRERLDRLREATADLDSFKLEIVDAASCTLRFTVAQSYLDLLTELEVEAPILDLNLLFEAYRLELVRTAIEAEGYDKGYLSDDSGLSLALSGLGEGEYCFYGRTDEGVTPAAYALLTEGSVFSQFRAFPAYEDESGFYTLETGGRSLLRHPYFPASGEYADVLLSSVVLGSDLPAQEAVYLNVQLAACPDRAAVKTLAAAHPETCIAWTLQNDAAQTVYVNQTAASLRPAIEYGWRLTGPTG